MEYSVHHKDSTDRIYERNGQSKHHRNKDNWLLVKSGKSYVNNKDGRVARQYKRRNGICNEEPELNREVVKDPRRYSDYKGSGPSCGLWPLTFKKIDSKHVGLPPIRDVSIFNLNDNCSEEYLKRELQDSPPMTDLRIIYHPTTGRHMKMAVASFESRGCAKYFAEKFNNKSILGENIKCFRDLCAFGLSQKYENITGLPLPLLKNLEKLRSMDIIDNWKSMWLEKIKKTDKIDYSETISTPKADTSLANKSQLPTSSLPSSSTTKRSHSPSNTYSKSSKRRRTPDKVEVSKPTPTQEWNDNSRRRSHSNSNSDSDRDRRSYKRNRTCRSYSRHLKRSRSPSYDSDYGYRRKSKRFDKSASEHKSSKSSSRCNSSMKEAESKVVVSNGKKVLESSTESRSTHETGLANRLKMLFPQRFQGKETNGSETPTSTSASTGTGNNNENTRPKISFSLNMSSQELEQNKSNISSGDEKKSEGRVETQKELDEKEKFYRIIQRNVDLIPFTMKECWEKFCKQFNEVINGKINKGFVSYIHEIVDKEYDELYEEHQRSLKKSGNVNVENGEVKSSINFATEKIKTVKKVDWGQVFSLPKIQKIDKDITKKKKDKDKDREKEKKFTSYDKKKKEKSTKVRKIVSPLPEEDDEECFDISTIGEPISPDEEVIEDTFKKVEENKLFNIDSNPPSVVSDKSSSQESESVHVSSISTTRSSTALSSYYDDEGIGSIKHAQNYSETAYDTFGVEELMSNIVDNDFDNVDDKRFQVLSQFNPNIPKVKFKNAMERSDEEKLKIISFFEKGFADDEDRLFLKDVLEDEDVFDTVCALKESSIEMSFIPAPKSYSKPEQFTKPIKLDDQVYFYNDRSLGNLMPTIGGTSKLSEHKRGVKKYRTLIRQTDYYKANFSKDEESASLLKKSKKREEKSLLRQTVIELEKFTPISKKNQLKYRNKMTQFKKSHIHGYGLFALEDISPNDMIIEYVGEKIRSTVCDVRERAYERRGMGSSYFFRIDEQCVIDATLKGGVARFINHCCVPNSYARIISVGKDPRIVIYSKRTIKKGEEITYDYKFPIEDEKIPCLCGHPGCRKFLN